MAGIVPGGHFTGEQFDSGLNQYYLRARYYNQSAGVFSSLDPYAGNKADPQSLHKYAYCHNTPINGIDPSGHNLVSTITGLAIAGLMALKITSIVANVYSGTRNLILGIQELFDGNYLTGAAHLFVSALNFTFAAIDAATLFTFPPLPPVGGALALAGGGIMYVFGAKALVGYLITTAIPALRHTAAGLAGLLFSEIEKGESNGSTNDSNTSPGQYSGNLVKVDKPDPDADALAADIGGVSRVKFSNDPLGREFDAISNAYIGQVKPANFQVNAKFRKQAKATFEAALETGRKVYFRFMGPPQAGVVEKINEYSARYGVEAKIEIK